MAKSQKHGNKEAKKPKQLKTAAPAPAAGLLGRAGAVAAPSKRRG